METNRVFSAEKGIKKIELDIKKNSTDRKMQKSRSILGRFPTTFKYGLNFAEMFAKSIESEASLHK